MTQETVVKHFDDTEYTGNPDFNYADEPGHEGRVETYSPHIDEVQKHMIEHPNTVWTMVEGDDGKLYILAGYHYVNRFLYFISNEEWEDENEQYLWE